VLNLCGSKRIQRAKTRAQYQLHYDPCNTALLSELAKTADLDSIAVSAKAQRVQLYTASHLAIHPETRAERGYLHMLAGWLGLADALIVSTAKV
jgi:uncharacterized membrane protein YebE (DUF533 family)